MERASSQLFQNEGTVLSHLYLTEGLIKFLLSVLVVPIYEVSDRTSRS